MAYTTLPVGSGHMYYGEFSVGVCKILIQPVGIVQVGFIGSLSLPLIHGQTVEEKGDCLFIIHDSDSS